MAIGQKMLAGLRIAAIVLSGVAPGACAGLQSLGIGAPDTAVQTRDEVEPPSPSRLPGIEYDVSLTGVEKDDLRDLLLGVSQLFALKDRLPATVGMLRRRARGDVDRLRTALHSEAYYGAELAYEIDRTARPVAVSVRVAPGPRYTLADYTIAYERSPPPEPNAQPIPENLGVEIGAPARAPDILAAERALIDHLADNGHPFARIVARRNLVNHTARTMTVQMEVDPGAFVRFGDTEIEGLSSVEDDHARGLLTWSEGEPFDRSKVDAARTALSESGLFASVQIAEPAEPEPDGRVPMNVIVTEADHRTIGFGASFSTSEGFGGEVYWEHRNLLGRNEQFRLSFTAAEIEQVVAARFQKPGFWAPSQTLLAETVLANRNTDAFDEQSVSASIGLARPWAENWQVTAGVSAEYSIVTEDGDETTFQLFGLPLAGVRDARDNALDPTEGSRIRLSFTPYLGRDGGAVTFAAATASGSAYYSIDAADRFVLAGRAKIGSIFGEETESVPASKRFFAGGGGSIRGFEFQSVGPLDEEDDPIGGRSLLELKGELRVKVTDTIGLVPFIDGGSVFDSPYPDFDETLRFGAGIGVRYFTDFGPLRFDVAVPINKRDIDDDFQFYISLGQAF